MTNSAKWNKNVGRNHSLIVCCSMELGASEAHCLLVSAGYTASLCRWRHIRLQQQAACRKVVTLTDAAAGEGEEAELCRRYLTVLLS